MKKIFFVGQDKRTTYLKDMYEKDEGISVVKNIEEAEYVVTTIPLSKDGVYVTGTDILIQDIVETCIGKTVFSGGISKDVLELFNKRNIQIIDIMKLDAVALLNAIPTAEGAIAKAIEYTDYTIHGSNVMILGFGRVGKILADKLKGLNANVFCEARKKKDLAHIFALGYNVVDIKNITEYVGNMDIIFSTIPSVILNEEIFKMLKKDVIIIDLASNPGSVDYDAAKKLGIKAFLELAIPTKVAPASSASYLKETVDDYIFNEF